MACECLVQYLDMQCVCLLLHFHWHTRSLGESEWTLWEHRNGLQTREKLSPHCAHTGRRWPGELGRYDKGHVGHRTSHCCAGRSRNQLSGWKHNGISSLKMGVKSDTRSGNRDYQKKEPLLLETRHVQTAKSARIKKTHLATQMKKTRVCSRKWAYSWFRIIVLFTSCGPITE